MYCDFPAYQNLQDYYETYVYALVQEMDLLGFGTPRV